MKELEEIIQLAQKILSCPVCHRHYGLGEIKLQAFLEDIYVLQVGCQNYHHPVMMTAIISRHPLALDLGKEFSTRSLASDPLKSEDISQLADSLTTFEGDWQNLWKQ